MAWRCVVVDIVLTSGRWLVLSGRRMVPVDYDSGAQVIC